MKKNYLRIKKQTFLLTSLALIGFSSVKAQVIPTSVTYSYTGAMQSFTVPPCAGSVTITVAGAKGVGTTSPYTWAPGKGGIASGVLAATTGQVLNIFVGGTNGFNGGGPGLLGANGGGASDVRVGGVSLSDRVIVAGGGGGAGGDNWGCNVGSGDGGGGTPVGSNFVGGAGGAGYTSGSGCGGNGSNSGGSGGNGTHGGGGGGGGLVSGGGGATCTVPGNGGTGVLGSGGSAFLGAGCASYGTGGGGGGYYGGGGAAGNNCGAGRGGGGSSWTGTLTAPSFTSGTNNADGFVIITYGFAPPTITITASSSTVCSGQSVTLTASGSTGYTWSNSGTGSSIVVNPTSSTNYSVAGTSTAVCPPYGLSYISTIPLPNIIPTSSSNFTVCPNTQITLNASGATTYTWSNSVSSGVPFFAPNATSVYTVSGTDANTNCSNTSTIMLSVFPTSVGVSQATTICSGYSALLSASGAMSYTWNPNNLPFQSVSVSPLSTTIYTVTALTSNFCSASNTLQITVNPSPTVSVSSSNALICKGESTSLNASGATSFLWSNSSTTPSISVSPTVSTMYSVNGVSNGCTSNTATLTVVVNFCTGISQLNTTEQNLISIYPNPNNGNFTIKSENNMNISLVNELGQVIRNVSLNGENNRRFAVTGLSSGIYFIISPENNSLNQKIIVDSK